MTSTVPGGAAVPDVAAMVADQGFAVVDVLDAAAVAALRAVVDTAELADDHGFYASPAMSHGSVATSLARRLWDVIGPHMAVLLSGHRGFMAGITSKGRRSDTPVPMHQDWTYTDERVAPVVFMWFPLVDVDETNGALRVIPGSHRWTRHLRPSRETEASADFEDALVALSTTVSLSAGQALAFDPASFHGSGPNFGDELRPAVTTAFVPTGTQLLHFHQGPDGVVEGFAVDDAFFTENPYRTRPTGYPSVTPHLPALTAELLGRLIAEHGG